MYALFDDAGKFLAGRILSEAEASAQIELESGKRVKVKAAQMLLKFDKPAPAALLSEASALAQTIELELAWEFAPHNIRVNSVSPGSVDTVMLHADVSEKEARRRGIEVVTFDFPYITAGKSLPDRPPW